MPKSRRRKGVKTTCTTRRRYGGNNTTVGYVGGKSSFEEEKPKTRPSRITRFVQAGGLLGRRKKPEIKYASVSRPTAELERKAQPTQVHNPYAEMAKREQRSSSVKGQRVTMTQTVPSRTFGIERGGSTEIKVGGEPLPPKN
jgi:hypothetical protein